MTENRKLKVFLCHSKDDKPKVRELFRRLVADGFDAWLDEEKLLPGQDWDLEIRKAVREANAVVVCLSKSSITKEGYVQKEIRFALDIADEKLEGAIFIIPARLEDCEVPDRLNKWHWVNLFNDSEYQRLRQSLESRAKFLRILSKMHFEPEMIQIPAGKFLMGSTKEQITQTIKLAMEDRSDTDWIQSESPQHTVELSEYFIGKYPITNREYQAFVRDARYIQPRGWSSDEFPVGKGNYPVVCVSWNDVSAYCKWLSEKSGKQYRLPTEAEWEKAARGKDGRVYSWGSDFDLTKANTREAQIGDISEVGKFSPQGDSPYSCVDMIGNVWEWCNDWFDENEYKGRADKIVKDPQGPREGRVGMLRILRGGSCSTDHWYARCADRLMDFPERISWYYGFRVASSLPK